MSKDAAPVEGEAPKKKGKMLIIIIAVVAVLALAGGGAAVFLLTSKPAAEKKAKADHGDEEVADEEEDEEDGGDDLPPVYERLETFTVNLADQESYLQTEVQLMLANVKAQEKIKARMPEVRDSLIRLLSSKTADELAQPEGKAKLAEEVQKAVNGVLGVKKSKGVKKVLFAAFIIQ